MGAFQEAQQSRMRLAVKLAGMGLTASQISKRTGMHAGYLHQLANAGKLCMVRPAIERAAPPDGYVYFRDFAKAAGCDGTTAKAYFRKGMLAGVVVGPNLFIKEGQTIDVAREAIAARHKDWIETGRRVAARAKVFVETLEEKKVRESKILE
jgi:hypothetical protein